MMYLPPKESYGSGTSGRIRYYERAFLVWLLTGYSFFNSCEKMHEASHKGLDMS